MKINEIVLGQKVIVQIVWGEQKIEFTTEVVEKDPSGIYVKPYIHDGKPLVFNIDNTQGVLCNLFTDDYTNSDRISWKNIKLKTEERKSGTRYWLTTSVFNQNAKPDDRRKKERIRIHKPGRIYDPMTDKYTDVMIHDISDDGISFYAPTSYQPRTNVITLAIDDAVDDKAFNLTVECSVARTENKLGNVFYGCKIVGENREYLIYGFMKKLKKKGN